MVSVSGKIYIFIYRLCHDMHFRAESLSVVAIIWGPVAKIIANILFKNLRSI